MKKNLKSQEGISLISLSVAVLIILVLTGIVLTNLKGNLGIQKLQNMQADIENLRDKVDTYYSKYGEIPAKIICTESCVSFSISDEILGNMDYKTQFYVIDLSALENLTLNYGKGYENITDGTTQINEALDDVYIINKVTHNIFLAGGVMIDNEVYYTNYTASDVDSGTIDIVEDIEELNNVSISKNNGRVFMKNAEITDDYGNKVVVPLGFKIAEASADNVIGGVVIEDVTHEDTIGSQFVWIPVGTIYKNEEQTESEKIELARYDFDENGVPSEYSGSYVEEDSTDEDSLLNYGNAIAKDINQFKNSVENNGGYYIGRYEARVEGYDTPILTSNTNNETNWTGYQGDNVKLVEKGDAQVFNYITQNKAAEFSRAMYENDDFESDLVNSYAWDTATLFLQTFGDNNKYSRQKSLNTAFESRGTNYSSYAGQRDKQCNVYDMASNCFEWTTESSMNTTYQCSLRGGYWNDDKFYVCHRNFQSTVNARSIDSFRPILYIK